MMKHKCLKMDPCRTILWFLRLEPFWVYFPRKALRTFWLNRSLLELIGEFMYVVGGFDQELGYIALTEEASLNRFYTPLRSKRT